MERLRELLMKEWRLRVRMFHLRCSFLIVALTCLAACRIATPPGPGAFVTTVNPAVVPTQPMLLTHGRPEPVAASRDANGVQSEFLEGIVLLKPRSAPHLQSFLRRYDGTIVSDDTVPEPAPGTVGTLRRAAGGSIRRTRAISS